MDRERLEQSLAGTLNDVLFGPLMIEYLPLEIWLEKWAQLNVRRRGTG